jgi:hypothetical protein
MTRHASLTIQDAHEHFPMHFKHFKCQVAHVLEVFVYLLENMGHQTHFNIPVNSPVLGIQIIVTADTGNFSQCQEHCSEN